MKSDLYAQMRNVLRITWIAVDNLLLHGGTVRAGYIAFYMLLGIFPFLIFLTHATGLVLGAERSQDVVSTLLSFAPEYVRTALQPTVDEVLDDSRIDIMSIAFLASVWFPSKAIDGVRGGFARAYGTTKNRSWVVGRTISVLCVMLGVVIALVLSALVILGPLLSNLVSVTLKIQIPFIAEVLRNVAGFFIFLLYLWFLNRILSSQHFASSRDVWTGVVVSGVMWVILAIGFGTYLNHSTTYQAYYGTLAGTAIAMLFFYYSALIVLLSAEINAARQETRPESV